MRGRSTTPLIALFFQLTHFATATPAPAPASPRYFVDVERCRFGDRPNPQDATFYPIPNDPITRETYRAFVEALFHRIVDVKAVKTQTFPIEAFGELWSSMILSGREAMKRVPTDRRLDVKFDDVQLRPAEETRRLIRFIDPALEDEERLANASALPRPGAPKYLQLDEGERNRLTAVCAPELEALGYELE